MPVHVRFRFNKLTGEVEEFIVDDQNRQLGEAEHERIAGDVGRVISRRPLLSEVAPLVQQPVPQPVPPSREVNARERQSESTPAADAPPQRLAP